MTLANLRQQDRDGLQGVFLQPIARQGANKNNAADRMSPVDNRSQGVRQRVVEGRRGSLSVADEGAAPKAE